MTGWRPTSGPEVAARRAAMLRRLRDYFETHALLEVDTPALSNAAVSDVHIESLTVRSSLTDTPLYLHTSPEFCMKRLLAAGYPDIFSICRVFRDGEAGRNHQPEFTLAEWYRHGFDLGEIILDALNVISAVLDDTALVASASIINYQDAFVHVVGVDPVNCSSADLANAIDADDALHDTVGDQRSDWLDLVLATKIAPSFASSRLTVLQHYPAPQAALARICPANAAFADRFEVFMGRVELANGYVELTDAGIQAARIADDQADRKRRNRPLRPHDESLIAALASGLPQCAGVAMGIERLQMIHEKTDDIQNVIPFLFEERDE